MKSQKLEHRQTKKATAYAWIGDGWHKQGPKVKYKSLKLYPDSVDYINKVAQAGLPINLTIMPNPAHKRNPEEPPLKVFLVYTKLV